MSLTPMPRWSKDTEVFVRPSHFHAGPGVVEIYTRYKDLNNVQHAPVEHIAEATEAALRELAYEVGRRAVFA